MFEKLFTVFLVAIVLGIDSFSLAMGMGLKGVTRRYELQFSGLVGIFHIGMPLLGLGLGMATGKLIGLWASRLGALILAYLGINMLIKARRENTITAKKMDMPVWQQRGQAEGWLRVLILPASVSIDALTVGFSLGTIDAPILLTVIIMGAVAAVMTLLGFRGGKIFGRLAGKYAQMVGGLVLLALAVKMLK